MKISVIIPTYNEAQNLEACLISLAGQNYKNFEVILIDDGSNDDTLSILSQLKIPNLKLLILRQKHLGPGAARNLGASRAEGEILVFVDADMTFDKNFLGNLVKPILDSKSKGTFSKYEYVSNWDNVWARCWNINQNWEAKRRHPKNYPDKQKVFRAILKSEFDRVGGFTPGDYTDDYSLYDKLGYMAHSAPGAIFYHKNPFSLAEIYNQARWVGKRKYKLGLFGYLIGLIRVSLPVSLVIGSVKAVLNSTPAFVIFKPVYDFGSFIGIVEYVLWGKKLK